jgi:hypothetical protein
MRLRISYVRHTVIQVWEVKVGFMDIVVNHVCQAASGGSYVAKYRAAVELSIGDGVTEIRVINTIRFDADANLLNATVEQIRIGAETVLRRRGYHARIVLSDLVIHDVDCNPFQYRRFTEEEFDRSIE